MLRYFYNLKVSILVGTIAECVRVSALSHSEWMVLSLNPGKGWQIKWKKYWVPPVAINTQEHCVESRDSTSTALNSSLDLSPKSRGRPRAT